MKLSWRPIALTALTAASVAFSQMASAQAAVLNFDDLPYQTLFANLEYQGFRFSPNCHIEITGPGGFNPGDSPWLGFDLSACSGQSNPSYVGPPMAGGSHVFVQRLDGAPFSLTSFTVVSALFSVSSSNGGVRGFMAPGAESFSGAEWSNLQWLLFSGGGGSPRGIDDLSVVTLVPEPSALWLAALGVLATTYIGKKRTAADYIGKKQ